MPSEREDRLRRILTLARYEACRLGLPAIEAEHLLLGLSRHGDERVEQLLQEAGLTEERLRQEVEGSQQAAGPIALAADLPLSADCRRALALAAEEARRFSPASDAGAPHVVLGILRAEGSRAAQILGRYGLTLEAARRELDGRAAGGPAEPLARLPLLARYGRDLTAIAARGGFDPLVGRGRELLRLAHILGRRTKNHPILVGEPGVGKTALVEGLARRIVERRVPAPLLRRRLVALDLSALVAGTQYRGQFEERLTGLLDELRGAEDWIVFLDEIHTLVGTGAAEGSLDAAHILKPALSRGEICCIGATTPREYRLRIEKDRALARRFQPIEVAPPSPGETLAILEGIRGRYERFHDVVYSPESLAAAVRQSQRYLPERQLPDKAIDVLDEAGSWVRLLPAVEDSGAGGVRTPREVGEEHVNEVIAAATGIPVTRLRTDEAERLRHMERRLAERVVGQEPAIGAVARAIRRSRLGVGNARRPIGSFLFVGPSGVGKTELARRLAEFLFDSQDAMVRFDMSEYMERHAVSKLIGSPPGYVGFEEGGQLTERMRRRPYSVVLFDEIEKAHPDVSNLLLQILEDGRLTDSVGNPVSFRDAVVLLTSNVGGRLLAQRDRALGFGPLPAAAGAGLDRGTEEEIRRRLGQAFRPELLNRLDEIVFFQPLGAGQLRSIAGLMLADLDALLAPRGVRLRVSAQGIDWLLRQAGVDASNGARRLRRTIQRLVQDPLSELLVDPPVAAPVQIDARLEGDRLDFRFLAAPAVTTPAPPPLPTAAPAGTAGNPGNPG